MQPPFLRTLSWLIALAAAAIVAGPTAVSPTFAQTIETPATAAPPSRDARAQQIEDLAAMKGARAADPRALFRLPLVDFAAPKALPALLRLMDDPAALRAAQEARTAGRPLPDGVDSLVLAQASFLSLPRAERARILAPYAASPSGDVRPPPATVLKQLESEIAALRAVLREKDQAQAGPRQIPIIDALAEDEAVLDPKRRRALLEAIDAAEAAAAERSAPPALASARQEIDKLRAQALALDPPPVPARGAPDVSPDAALAQMDEARAQALVAARDARTESIRLIETERAALLQVRKAQAEFEQRLTAQIQATAADREAALVWNRRVRDIAARSLLDPRREEDAGRLYDQLVEALKDVRSRLWVAFGDVVAPAPPPSPAAPDPALEAVEHEARGVMELHGAISREAARLADLSAEAQWRRAVALREAMVVMNDARLRLIPELGRASRTQVLGFGPEGFAQARREVEQIALEAQYNALLAPRVLADLASAAQATAARAVLLVAELVLAVIAFRFWRRQGGGLIRALQRTLATRQPPSLTTSAAARVLGHVYAVRRPLDWLILLLALALLVPRDLRFPGVDYVWIGAVWALLASLAVGLAESIWKVRGESRQAGVWRRSIRLVAWTVALLGLTLSLARAIVGTGALYNWAVHASWVAVVPTLLLLLHWWRHRIEALAVAGAERNVMLAWAARPHGGPIGFVARAGAAAVLIGAGARTMVAHRANQVALLREIFDYRRRRRTEAAVRADAESGRYATLSGPMLAALSPRREPLDLDAGVPQAPEDLNISRGEVVAVIGDRGLGKSTRLAQMAARWAEGRAIVVRAEATWEATRAALATALSAKSPSEADVAAALRRGGPWLVCIDDAQAIVRPVINGLAGLERLVAFARTQGDRTAWAIAVSSLAWEFVERAHDNRALVDRACHLPRWSDGAIADLVARRTEQAGARPQFEKLHLPTTLAMFAENDREARARAAYFQLLTDYAKGNPAVALELWRRSLRLETESGDVVVRMFPTPPVEEFDALPLSVFFVVRALLRLDVADDEALARSTGLPAGLVADAMRRLAALGAVEQTGRSWRVSLFWHRDLVRALERQNMLQGIAA